MDWRPRRYAPARCGDVLAVDDVECRRHVLRYGMHAQEAESLLAAAAILSRWGSLSGIAGQLEKAAELYECKAERELDAARTGR